MVTYLKKATKTPVTEEGEAQRIVEGILKDVRENGEDAYFRHYGAKFRNWSEKIVLTKEEIEERAKVLVFV